MTRYRQLKAADVFADPDFPLAVFRHEHHGVSDMHCHAFHELVVILAGSGLHLTEEGNYPIEAGDVFLLRDHMAHGYGEPAGMTLVNVLFDPKRLELPLAHLRDLPGYHALFRVEPRLRKYHRFRHRLRLAEEDLAEAGGLIFRLRQEVQNRRPGYRFLACAHLMALIGLLSRCYEHPQRDEARPLLRIGEALSYIEQHYAEPIAISQLAQIAHMSESTLLRTFRLVLGRPPIEHIIRLRVQRAAEMLSQPDARITAVAFACGFNDSNYFSRQFRKVMGMTPRAFRARQRPPDRRGAV